MSPCLYRLAVVLHGFESKDDKQKSQSVYWKMLSTRASSALETWQKREVTSKWITKIDRQLIGDAICLFVCLFVCLLLLFFIIIIIIIIIIINFFFLKFFLNNDIVDSSIFWLPIYNILEHQPWGGVKTPQLLFQQLDPYYHAPSRVVNSKKFSSELQ